MKYLYLIFIFFLSCQENVQFRTVYVYPDADIYAEAKEQIEQPEIEQAEEKQEHVDIDISESELTSDAEIEVEAGTKPDIEANKGYTLEKDASLERMNFIDAEDWCKKRGFEIPTIDELRDVFIQNTDCPVTEENNKSDQYEKGCNKADDPNICNFNQSEWNGACNWYWTSTKVSDKWQYYWVIHFETGIIGYDDITDIRYVRCVKRG